jgi:hypothetical protein
MVFLSLKNFFLNGINSQPTKIIKNPPKLINPSHKNSG